VKNILFICIENSGRSQMAEAFARTHGKNMVSVFSAGSHPSGKINSNAVGAMKEAGYDLSQHKSKSINEFRDMKFDYIITMGCGDECPFISAKHREDWDIPDPKEMGLQDIFVVRDLIETKVKQLLTQVSSRN
jgi:protein-tyrosine-phosphatase